MSEALLGRLLLFCHHVWACSCIDSTTFWRLQGKVLEALMNHFVKFFDVLQFRKTHLKYSEERNASSIILEHFVYGLVKGLTVPMIRFLQSF